MVFGDVCFTAATKIAALAYIYVQDNSTVCMIRSYELEMGEEDLAGTVRSCELIVRDHVRETHVNKIFFIFRAVQI